MGRESEEGMVLVTWDADKMENSGSPKSLVAPVDKLKSRKSESKIIQFFSTMETRENDGGKENGEATWLLVRS